MGFSDLYGSMNQPLALRTHWRALIQVALPISLGTLLQFVVVLTDNFFLARLSEKAINGAGNAALVYLTLQMLAIGSGAALQITIARRMGEGNREMALKTFRSGLLIHGALGCSLMLIAFLLNQGLLGQTIANAGVRAIFEPFLSIRTLGFIPFSLLLAYNALYTGTARTWPIVTITGTTAVVNVILDAGWVEGWWGMPTLGADGAAWASLVAETVGCTLSALLTLWVIPDAYRPWNVMDKLHLQKWRKLATPLMGQLILTVGTWTSFFFFVEKVGGMELKVSHVTRNMFMLAFVVAQGMNQTTRTYVSGLLGEGRQSELTQTLRRIFTLNLGGIVVLCHGFILYPEFISSQFFDDPIGMEAMERTLRVVFVAILLESLTGIMLATIQGAGATRIAFGVEFASVTLYTLFAAAVTLQWPQPIWIIWRVEWLYFSCIGFGSWLYLRRGTWRTIQPV